MCKSIEVVMIKTYCWDLDSLWNFVWSEDFHDLFNDSIVWKAWKVEARSQVIESSSGIIYFFITEKFPIEKCWDDTLNNINDILLKRLIAFIKLLFDIKKERMNLT